MTTVRVQLLDEVLVEADGVRVAVGGPRARALIARLAIERGRALSVDALVDELWDEGSADSRNTLRPYMSRLRATALGPWLRGGRSGYGLAEHAGLEVDLWQIQDVIAPRSYANMSGERGLLRDWRCAPLQGIGEPPFASAARARIRRAVEAAQLQAARDHLETGRSDSALALLRSLRLVHPEDEDLLTLVRVAQARTGLIDRAFVRIADRVALERPEKSIREDIREEPDGSVLRDPVRITRRRGIPAPMARIVGRREERAALTAALDVARLITLTGSPGVGKTRLVVDWLRGDAVADEDHVWFVPVGHCDEEQVQEAIATVVDAPAPEPRGIAEHLAERRGILVIDGAERATDAVAAVTVAVLSRARGVAVLVTSRRALSVPGESVLRVDPLALDEAVELFRIRLSAETAQPPATAIAHLVERLGRLPLAIELAAARAAVMPSDEVAESMLRDIDHSAQAGEAPLAAALRSSLDLLTAQQRDTLRSISGFAAPFSRAAVAAVCGERPRDADLDRLVSFSLVSAETVGARPAFRVSEVVARAALRGEAVGLGWSARHRAWFRQRAAAASLELTAHGSARTIARLRAEWPDVLAAFRSAERIGDRSTVAIIASGLLWFGVRSGRQREVIELTRRACAVPGVVDDSLEAQLRLARGFVAYQLGSMAEAATWITAARAPALRSGDTMMIATARAFAAYLRTLAPATRGDSGRDIATAVREVEVMPDAPAAMVLLIAGQVHRAAGRAHDAIAVLERAERLASRCGHEWVALMAPVVTAKVHLDLRQGASAVAALLPVVRRSAKDGDPVSLLIAASVAAGAAAVLGADAVGARIIGSVDAVGRRYGFDPRANEPADFELYLRRVRQGLTADEWRAAYAEGRRCGARELVEIAESLAPRRP